MSASQLFRTGAVFLLVGGIAGFLGSVLSPNTTDPAEAVASPTFYPSAWLAFIGGILTMGAVPAAYARIAGRAGILGLAGFALLVVTGMLFAVFLSGLSLMIQPWVFTLPGVSAQQPPPAFQIFFPIAGLISVAAGILFGVAVIRSKVLAPVAGYLFILAGLLGLIPAIASEAPALVQNLTGDAFTLALAVLGFELWQNPGGATEMPVESRRAA